MDRERGEFVFLQEMYVNSGPDIAMTNDEWRGAIVRQADAATDISEEGLASWWGDYKHAFPAQDAGG